MIAGFFRLKERLTRRPGFAIDPLPVHLWKRTKEVFILLRAWGRFFKEMEEVWLQTRKKSDWEERCLEEIQRIQGEVWQVLRVPEWQKKYRHAKENLPARAKALLDPFEELCSKTLLSRKDLKHFLKTWQSLPVRLQELRSHLGRDAEPARKWVEELILVCRGIEPGTKIKEWHQAYARLSRILPFKFHLIQVKFDALTNRVVISREPLQKFWATTLTHLRRLKIWNIRPGKIVTALVKDFFLTTYFAFTFRSYSRFH